MVLFFAEASHLKRWCGVYRKDVSEKGYQRFLKKPHLDQIKSYLDKKEVIPNSLVIAFNDALEIGGDIGQGATFIPDASEHPMNAENEADQDTDLHLGRLKVRVHPDCRSDNIDEVAISPKRSAYVIDGQHRIEGGNASIHDTYFPVTGFLGVTKEDQAFHFIMINRKAKKLPNMISTRSSPRKYTQSYKTAFYARPLSTLMQTLSTHSTTLTIAHLSTRSSGPITLTSMLQLTRAL